MARTTDMGKLQDILAGLRAGDGIRALSRHTGAHRSVVRRLKHTAAEQGWLTASGPLPQEHELAEAMYGVATAQPHPFDPYLDQIKRWVRKKYSHVVISTLLKKRIPTGPCSESTVRRYIQSRMPQFRPAIMTREHRPGDSLEVDFGYGGLTLPDYGEKPRKTWYFSARLASSRHAYRTCVHSQNQYVFFNCIIEALEFFGGTPRRIVPDNLKAAVVKAAFYEPAVNRVFRKLALHYGFLISPCLPRTPEHKGGVENDIKYIKNNFAPVFLEQQHELGRDIPLFADMNRALKEWTSTTAGNRIVKGVGASPLEMFHGFEKEALQPLPERRWDPVAIRECTVGPDWRIRFDKSFYSVPHEYIGEKVAVIADSLSVCIFLKDNEISRHPRSPEPFRYVRKDFHAPPEQAAYMSTTREMLIKTAVSMGDAVRDVAVRILSDKAVDGLRPVRGLLRLAEYHTALRLERACTRALVMDTVSYASIKSILENRLEEEGLPEEAGFLDSQLEFSFSRKPDEYQFQF